MDKEGVNGIVGKIWAVRNGEVPIKSGTLRRTVPSGDKEVKVKEKVKLKKKRMDEYETEEEAMSEEEEAISEEEEVKKKVEEMERVGAYLGKKKRRIAESSEDEE